MKQYLDLVKHVLENGNEKSDRTGTGTKSVFGYQLRFDLSEGFPMITTKKVHLKSIIHELLWFLKGETNIEYLKKENIIQSSFKTILLDKFNNQVNVSDFKYLTDKKLFYGNNINMLDGSKNHYLFENAMIDLSNHTLLAKDVELSLIHI